MVQPRIIIHLDLDAFFCAVEEQRDPSLRGKAFAVGGRPGERGVVSSCSYAARRYGVRSAMPMARAVSQCPNLLVVPARHDAYREASQEVMARLHALTPLVEQLSIDEAFLDVSALTNNGEALARALQTEIRDSLALPCSLGVASNKLVAKIATDAGKAAVRSSDSPSAVTVVPPGTEAAFLAPLPTSALWGVGPKMEERLANLGIRTIGEIAAWPERDLLLRFGKHGHDLHRRAQGIDNRPIQTSRAAKSHSKETTFARDVRDLGALRDELRGLANAVSLRVRRDSLRGTTVKLKLRWDDFTTISRQATLAKPTDDGATIGAEAIRLLEAAWQEGRPVRLIGVGLSGFANEPEQLSLWDSRPAHDSRIQSMLAAMRARFGDQAVRWGKDLDGEA